MADPAVNRRTREVFLDVHSDLPRQGPGNRACTERALNMTGPLGHVRQVLDVACGPGMQTLDLADLLPGATITAVDARADYVAEGQRRAALQGASERVEFVQGDMASLPFAAGGFDLLWCEGAAYIMGVENALRSWRPLLGPGGRLALSEAVWLRADPPGQLRDWWDHGYPGMRNVEGCRELVRAAGFDLLGDFVLPEDAWWEHYYLPLLERLDLLANKYEGDRVAQGVLQGCRDEIAFYREYADYYGYVFLVMAA